MILFYQKLTPFSFKDSSYDESHNGLVIFEKKMGDLEKEIERINRFVDDYHLLGHGHMVSFFTDNYYDEIIMPSARKQARAES